MIKSFLLAPAAAFALLAAIGSLGIALSIGRGDDEHRTVVTIATVGYGLGATYYRLGQSGRAAAAVRRASSAARV